MTVRFFHVIMILTLTTVFLVSCTEQKPQVSIVQYTDASHITAIVEYNGNIYSATKGGLVKWDLPTGGYTIYTTADGLSSNNITGLLIDKDNRLWASTDSGVSVFDGTSWEKYGVADGLPTGETKGLSIDNDGTIWVATTKGVASFNNGSFEILTEEKGLINLNIECVYFDRGGNMWVGTADKGVFIKFEDKWIRTGSKNGLITDAANSIIQTWDNSIWASSWAGIARWDGFGWAAFKPMKRLGTFKASQLSTSEGRLWFFTANGVHTSRGSEWRHFTEEEGLVSNDVTCGYVVNDDMFYVGTTSGMSVVNDGKIENYVVANTQSGNNCISLAIDEKSRVWVGTWETGLNLYHNGYWSRMRGIDGSTFDTVRDIVFTSGCEIIFNTREGVVFKNDTDWDLFTRKNGVAGDDVRCGVYDTNGTYWVGTSTGISSLSKGRWKRYRAVHGLPSEDIWACVMDSEGTVWFGTSNGIISIVDNELTDRSPEIALSELDVRSVALIGSTVWFGTENGKIVTYENGTWDIIGNNYLGTDKGIYSITMDPSGVMWFGTNGDGVVRVEGKSSVSYTIKDGLPSNFVRDLAWTDGVLWAACYGGVAAIKPVE
ncbi:two-component regulator propeller domain-containing protein [Candidatus Latescibacterota bacterium]